MSATKNRKEYYIFSGKSLRAAHNFLLNNTITATSVYYIVSTPEGTLCADIDGIERIPDMQ